MQVVNLTGNVIDALEKPEVIDECVHLTDNYVQKLMSSYLEQYDCLDSKAEKVRDILEGIKRNIDELKKELSLFQEKTKSCIKTIENPVVASSATRCLEPVRNCTSLCNWRNVAAAWLLSGPLRCSWPHVDRIVARVFLFL